MSFVVQGYDFRLKGWKTFLSGLMLIIGVLEFGMEMWERDKRWFPLSVTYTMKANALVINKRILLVTFFTPWNCCLVCPNYSWLIVHPLAGACFTAFVVYLISFCGIRNFFSGKWHIRWGYEWNLLYVKRRKSFFLEYEIKSAEVKKAKG